MLVVLVVVVVVSLFVSVVSLFVSVVSLFVFYLLLNSHKRDLNPMFWSCGHLVGMPCTRGALGVVIEKKEKKNKTSNKT